MKKSVVVVVLLAFCGLGSAQSKPDNQLSPTVRLYQPKVRDGSTQLARFVASVVKGVTITWEPTVDALVIHSDNPQDLDAAEALLKRFDVPRPSLKLAISPAPSPQVEVTAYLVVAANGPTPAKSEGSAKVPAPQPIPADLQSAVDEMKHTFSYEHYALADALIVQPNGAGAIQGEVAVGPYVLAGTTYSLSYKYTGFGESATGNPADRNNLYLNSFEFKIVPPNGIERKIQTNVAMHLNQKLVLGKIRLSQSDNSDLFVILTAKPR
jgi:hypothetical protein